MKQSVICRCDSRSGATRYFCSDCGGAFKASDASSAASYTERGLTTKVSASRASEAELEQSYLEWKSHGDPGIVKGENTDWMTCPHCHVTGHLEVRKCKTWCGNCKQLISTCADL